MSAAVAPQCPRCGSMFVSTLRAADGAVRLVCRGSIGSSHLSRGIPCLHTWLPEPDLRPDKMSVKQR